MARSDRDAIPSIRPALVAGTVLAAGRAIGEAIALAMVAGSVAWIPNIKDGWVFLMEPVHPLAALIVNNSEGLPVQPLTTDASRRCVRSSRACCSRSRRGSRSSRDGASAVASRTIDTVGRSAAWLCGIVLMLIFGGTVVYLGIKGIGSLSWSFLTTSPNPGDQASLGGGILEPLMGTVILAVLGTLIALPLGVAVPVFLAEYRRPAWLARFTELAVEVIFGVPSIVFTIFGVALFTNPKLIFLSSGVASSPKAFGRSFLVAGVVLVARGTSADDPFHPRGAATEPPQPP